MLKKQNLANVNITELKESEYASLISGISVAELDEAIGDVNLQEIIKGDTIDIGNSSQLESLADALKDVDLEEALDTYIS